jgi:hypothetical protein
VGRAFGIFLLVVGLGLAAYGLPSSETEWPSTLSAIGDAPPKTGAGEGTSDRKIGLTPLAPSRAVAARRSDRSTTERGTASASSETYVAPMDKLRAAGQERANAEADAVAIHRPSSVATQLDSISVPKPVEVIPPLLAKPPAPAVVSTARRESALVPKGPVDAAAKPGNIAQARTSPSMPAASNPVAAGSSSSRFNAAATTATAATAATVTLSVSPSYKPSTIGAVAATISTTPTPDKPARAAESAAQTVDELAKPTPDHFARQQVAQRYVPPSYLMKPPSGLNASGSGSPPRRSFNSRAFWESSQRLGL